MKMKSSTLAGIAVMCLGSIDSLDRMVLRQGLSQINISRGQDFKNYKSKNRLYGLRDVGKRLYRTKRRNMTRH